MMGPVAAGSDVGVAQPMVVNVPARRSRFIMPQSHCLTVELSGGTPTPSPKPMTHSFGSMPSEVSLCRPLELMVRPFPRTSRLVLEPEKLRGIVVKDVTLLTVRKEVGFEDGLDACPEVVESNVGPKHHAIQSLDGFMRSPLSHEEKGHVRFIGELGASRGSFHAERVSGHVHGNRRYQRRSGSLSMGKICTS